MHDASTSTAVITGLVPVIHVLRAAFEDVDGRVKPGHDEEETPLQFVLA